MIINATLPTAFPKNARIGNSDQSRPTSSLSLIASSISLLSYGGHLQTLF